MAYIDQDDLESRVSAAVLRQILDDDLDGTVDAAPLEQLCADATSKVDGVLRNKYPTWPDDFASDVPNEVKRLTLDVAVAMLAQRHPEYVRRDWSALMKHAEDELNMLSLGERRLDVDGAPEPAANQGGMVWDGGTDTTVPPQAFFIPGADSCNPGGMGDF